MRWYGEGGGEDFSMEFHLSGGEEFGADFVLDALEVFALFQTVVGV